ncbi:MAG TPA: serine hydrolase domain-containing protein [Verrucomicrobiae bacterium]
MQSIDSELAEFDRPDAPGLVWMGIERGHAAVTRAVGLANLETGSHCEPRTNFRLASVTKQFTAMAILILAERGKLSLDDKMARFLSFGRDIAVRHLLTHTSGLFDYEDLIPPGTVIALKDRDVLEILRGQVNTYFTPGANFHYSNGGYAMLALIVEAVSGRSFAAFLRENIFLPLGMDDSAAWEHSQPEPPHRAIGYSRRVAGFEETDQSLTSAVLGDGGIYSSALDLAKWDQALNTEKLISRELLRQAFMAHSNVSDMPGSGYGFGWYVEGQGDALRVWHHGSTCGFSTSFHRWPAKQCSLIALANRGKGGLERIARKFTP